MLSLEVNDFKNWVDKDPIVKKYGEWELEYPNWNEVYSKFKNVICSCKLSELCTRDLDDILYLIGRDNLSEVLIEEIELIKPLFESLANHVVNSNEYHSKWQFAVSLGKGLLDFNTSENLLLKLVNDTHEYTSRRALQSLGKLKSKYTEKFCVKAWDSNHEYQRMTSLWSLKEINSSLLKNYLKLALLDGRENLVYSANKIAKTL